MIDVKIDGRLQVTAGSALLDHSKVVRWDPDACRFVASDRDSFEASWRQNVDPAFGRMICWINFSAGAEFFVKGLCLLHGLEIRKEDKDVPCYPRQGENLKEWAAEVSKDFRLREVMKPTIYGEIGKLLPHKDRAQAPLKSLCTVANATPEQEQLLIAAYRLLSLSIRNRDAHAYVPNQRDQHYSLVPDLFADCLNLLAGWLPEGPSTLSAWKVEAVEFNRRFERAWT